MGLLCQRAAGAPPTTGLVHWADPKTWKGQIVRCVGNRLITITPMMDPTIDLSRHGPPTVVAPDVGERGDRRQPKDIRIPLPTLVNRLNRMWLAGLQPSISAVPCNVCGDVQKDDDVSFVCCNCLLTWHADCADQTNNILQAMLMPATPRYPPDGFPDQFHEVLCKLCGSLWAPREQQARMLKSCVLLHLLFYSVRRGSRLCFAKDKSQQQHNTDSCLFCHTF